MVFPAGELKILYNAGGEKASREISISDKYGFQHYLPLSTRTTAPASVAGGSQSFLKIFSALLACSAVNALTFIQISREIPAGGNPVARGANPSYTGCGGGEPGDDIDESRKKMHSAYKVIRRTV